jgi:hypothetical protein
MIDLDKAAPLAVSLKPRRFQDGVSSGFGEIGDISAMGLPCRSTYRLSPPSTSESNPDACLRNSVNVTVFMFSPSRRYMYLTVHYFVQRVRRISVAFVCLSGWFLSTNQRAGNASSESSCWPSAVNPA